MRPVPCAFLRCFSVSFFTCTFRIAYGQRTHASMTPREDTNTQASAAYHLQLEGKR